MKPTPPPACPTADIATVSSPSSQLHPKGTWPPGPRSGLTGWGLLFSTSRNLLGTLSMWRQSYGDMVHLRIWPEHQIVVCNPQLVRELLVNHHDDLIRWERGIQVFSQLHGKSVLTTEGELWRAKRQALQPSFSPKAVESPIPAIASAAAHAFSHWRTGDEHWPIESALTSLAMDVIIRVMFSSEIDEDARIAERAVHVISVKGNAEMYWPASWPDVMAWKREKRQAIALLDRLIKGHIEARLMKPAASWPEDLLSRLLRLHEENPEAWPLQAVRDECMTAFMAGHETTAATLTWWAWCMAANPEIQAAARQQVQEVLDGKVPATRDLPALGYLTQTLKETLRLYPAAPALLTRRAIRPITLGGWQLPKRTLFTVPLQLMHHDERWFADPQGFRPQRFADDAPEIPRGAFMPFGTGPRVCLGQHLAMTEMTVIAAMFLQRFAVIVLNGAAAPEPVFNITLRPKASLHLTLLATMPLTGR